MGETLFKVIRGEKSWICFQCRSVVRNFLVEDLKTSRDYVQPFVVDPDEEMIQLSETIGLETPDPAIVDKCTHDRYLRQWCREWRYHRRRINRVNKIIDGRLMDIDHCLGEWDKINKGYEEAGNDVEKCNKMFWKVVEFKKIFKDLLENEGPSADENFRKDMQAMRIERDRLLSGVPKIKEAIINLPTDRQERLLRVIKAQSDRFEASGVQPRPNEWTITKFYKELKAACDKAKEKGTPKGPEEPFERTLSPETDLILCFERANPSQVRVPPGVRVVATTSEADANASAVAAVSDTLFVDVACLMKLFTAVNSVPRTLNERPKAPPSRATGPAKTYDATNAAGPTKTSHATDATGPAKISDATDAPGLAKSSDATDAAGPAETSDATDATGPAKTSDATDAAGPAKTSHATNATGPAKTSHATDATGPAKPSEATDAAGPAETSNATDAAGPAETSDATDATGPAKTSDATDAAGPAETSNATDAAGPAKISDATDAAGPAKISDATDAAGPAKTSDTTDSAGPDETSGATDAAGPAETSDIIDAAGSTETSDTIDAAGSAKTSDIIDAAGPAETSNATDAAGPAETSDIIDASGSAETSDTIDAAGSAKTSDAIDAAGPGKTSDTKDAAGPAATSDARGAAGPSSQRKPEPLGLQIAKIDLHIRKLEKSRQKVIKSIVQIRKTLGEIIDDNEQESDFESDESDESTDVDTSE